MPHSSPLTTVSASRDLRLPRYGETAAARCRDSRMLLSFVTEEVFADVLASAVPNVVGRLLLVVVTDEVVAVVLANADTGVVPLILLVVEVGDAVNEVGGSPPCLAPCRARFRWSLRLLMCGREDLSTP